MALQSQQREAHLEHVKVLGDHHHLNDITTLDVRDALLKVLHMNTTHNNGHVEPLQPKASQ